MRQLALQYHQAVFLPYPRSQPGHFPLPARNLPAQCARGPCPNRGLPQRPTGSRHRARGLPRNLLRLRIRSVPVAAWKKTMSTSQFRTGYGLPGACPLLPTGHISPRDTTWAATHSPLPLHPGSVQFWPPDPRASLSTPRCGGERLTQRQAPAPLTPERQSCQTRAHPRPPC